MTVVAYAQGVSHGELLAHVDAVAPRSWVRESITTAWGSVSWAGDGVHIDGDWLILGRPNADPWGWPGRPVLPTELVARLELLGSTAMESVTGPCLALNLDTRQVVLPHNGLVPFYEVSGQKVVGGSTSIEVGRHLAKGAGTVSQLFPPSAARERDHRTHLDGHRVRSELMDQQSAAGIRADECVLVPPSGDPMWSDGATAVNRVRDFAESLTAAYWWKARLRNQWLYCPPLERPTIDRLLEMSA